MMSRRFRALLRTKGVVLAAVMLAFVASSTALAGSGVGAVFNLGRANSVNAGSTLSGSVAGRMLQVSNSSASTSAYAILATSRSSPQGTVISSNTGGGPALDLRVNSGKTPMKVNSRTRVANLNADQLDGVDSTGFLRSTAKAADADKLDKLDSTAFVRTRTYEAVRATFGKYVDGSSACRVAEPCHASIGCDAGDLLMSGGFGDIHMYTEIKASHSERGGVSWYVEWVPSGAEPDEVTVHALCSDTAAPAHSIP